MTERFSPEYIAFILSDEAKVLQEGHEWNLGDWFVHRETESIGLLAIKPDDKIIFVKKEAISWLPTLTDLLGMIEEASAGRQFVLGYVPEYKEWFTSLEIVGEETWPIQSNEPEDKELATAKPAVRVLEGKE